MYDDTNYQHNLSVTYEIVIMLMCSVVITGGCLMALLNDRWSYLLWSLLSIPIGLVLAFGLPLLYTVVGEPIKLVNAKLRVYYGGRRDIVRLSQRQSLDLRDDSKERP